MKEDMWKYLVKITAIICGTIFGVVCILQGLDHAVVFTIATIIAGLGGYQLGKRS